MAFMIQTKYFLVLLAFLVVRPLSAKAAEVGEVVGTVRDAKGTTLVGATVYLAKGQDCLIATCDGKGRFGFPGVKPAIYDYLAVSVPRDGQRFPFLFARKELEVSAGQTAQVDITYAPAQPPKPTPLVVNAPKELAGSDGKVRTRFFDVSTWNPFNWDWDRQRVGFRVHFKGGVTPNSVMVYDTLSKTLLPCQLSDEVMAKGNSALLSEATVHFFAEVKANTRPCWRILYDAGEHDVPNFEQVITVQAEGDTVTVNTGKIAARLGQGRQQWIDGREPAAVSAPLIAIRGTDGVWRGSGRLVAPAKITGMEAQVVRRGPIFVDYQARYTFANGTAYKILLRFEAGMQHFTAKEESGGLDGGSFEFSAYDNFKPDSGFNIHFGGDGVRDFKPLKYDADMRLAQIANYVHVLPFGYALTSTRDDTHDCLAVFSVNRGAWIDRLYSTDTWYPLQNDPDGQMRLNWMHYYGSPRSAISVEQRKGSDRAGANLVFRFPFHDGTREWGLVVYPKERNGQVVKVHGIDAKNGFIRELQIRVGDLTLDKFKDYILEWEPKPVERPAVNYGVRDLPQIQKNLEDPFFKELWRQERASPFKAFATGDPRLAWPMRGDYLRNVLEEWAIATLRGHDLGHVPYNQVSVRGLMELCETYDLLEPSALYEPAELARLRAGLALVGYRFNDRNFMAWQYNQGQQDFEAARLAGVGSVGFTLADHPHAAEWSEGSLERLKENMFVWQLPGGKWPENTPCYYQQSFCSYAYLAHQAARAGRGWVLGEQDFQEFVRWTLPNLTPPQPSDAGVMRRGLQGKTYAEIVKTRHLPGVGDHGAYGGVEIKYDAALVAKDLQQAAPDLSRELMWAFNRGGVPAIMGRKTSPANTTQMLPAHFLIACLTLEDLKAEKPPVLDSRQLRGFGVVMRAEVDTTNESFVMFRSGSTGVRYADSDNLLLYTAKGVPLLIDGGDQRENSTVLREDGGRFGPGRITKFRTTASYDYTVGEAPVGKPEVRRHVLFVKNSYVLVVDESLIDQPVVSRLVVLADATTPCNTHPGASFKGRLGTDLDVFIAGLEQNAEVSLGNTSMKWEGRPDAEALPLKKLTAKMPKHGECKMLLMPRAVGENAPASVEALGTGFRVKRGDTTDVVFAGKQTSFRGQGIGFNGTCGMARWQADGLWLHLIDGALLEAEELSVAAAGGSVFLHRTKDGKLNGRLENGPATVFIGTSLTAGPFSLKIDGKSVLPRLMDGRLLLLLPAGNHEFAVMPGK